MKASTLTSSCKSLPSHLTINKTQQFIPNIVTSHTITQTTHIDPIVAIEMAAKST